MNDAILFWTQVAAIGQVLGAAATSIAVIVSLWVVTSERRPKVKAQAGLRMVIGGGEPAIDVISVTISNNGLREVTVTSIGWRTGWVRGFCPEWAKYQWAQQNPEAQNDAVAGARPPFTLAPGQEKSLAIRVTPFLTTNSPEKQRQFFGRKVPWSSEVIPANVCIVVSLAAFRSTIVPVEKPLAAFLVSGTIESGADRFNALADEADG